ncbi:hypothetical protein [Leptolyngbya sp. NIES-2104]|uniref:hypothetical protein n=1 Tax=Leptolyngbya sp. NIES-2104 TaxID=1552121 RepID=UPI0006EC8A27|nr:hypothetical protein [Leptolyngbya sp. NIES-2104]GAP99162.1 hypothetical protein NIES2104_57210 [Leptolyngbya sp. NIES-2104]
MPYAILDNSVRKNLEQERDRLTSDRDSIIKAAVSAATTEIDQTLEYLNGLLGGQIEPPTNGKGKKAAAAIELPKVEAAPEPEAKPKQQRKGRGKAKAAVEETTTAAPEKKTRGKKKTEEAAPKKTRNVKPPVPFDATMKRDFKGMTPAEAVLKVLSGSPSDTFTTDEVIEILYGSLPSVNVPEARKRIALTLAHGMRKGSYEKVAENPSRFKIAG